MISFGMTAVLVMIGLGAYLEAETDKIDVEAPALDDGQEDQV